MPEAVKRVPRRTSEIQIAQMNEQAKLLADKIPRPGGTAHRRGVAGRGASAFGDEPTLAAVYRSYSFRHQTQE